MKKSAIITYAFFLCFSFAKAQVPYEKLDSLSVEISKIEKSAEGLTYKNSKGGLYELSFPVESFKIWSYNNLASKAVYKKQGNKEILALTENIDLSKAMAITVEQDYSGAVYIKVDFPKNYLKTQLIEDGKLINTINEDYLEFFSNYGKVNEKKVFLFDAMFDRLYEITTLLKIQKGTMSESDKNVELTDWNKLSNESFLAKHPKSLRSAQAAKNIEKRKKEEEEKLRPQIEFINAFAAKYGFKAGVTKEEFIKENPSAAFLLQEDFHSYDNKVSYKNTRKSKFYDPVGPNEIEFQNGLIYSYKFITQSGKTKHFSWAAHTALWDEVKNKIEAKYIKIEKFEWGESMWISVPGASFKQIGLQISDFFNYRTETIFFVDGW